MKDTHAVKQTLISFRNDTVIKKAEVAWDYAIKPLLEEAEKKIPDESQPSSDSNTPAKA